MPGAPPAGHPPVHQHQRRAVRARRPPRGRRRRAAAGAVVVRLMRTALPAVALARPGRGRPAATRRDHPGHAAADARRRPTIDAARDPTGSPSASAARRAARGVRASPRPSRSAASIAASHSLARSQWTSTAPSPGVEQLAARRPRRSGQLLARLLGVAQRVPAHGEPVLGVLGQGVAAAHARDDRRDALLAPPGLLGDPQLAAVAAPAAPGPLGHRQAPRDDPGVLPSAPPAPCALLDR